MMGIMNLDDAAKKRLEELKNYAENHIFTYDELMLMKNKYLPYVGDRDGHVCLINDGYRVVFSIEETTCKDRYGKRPKVRRCTISISGMTRKEMNFYHQEFKEILKLLGFIDPEPLDNPTEIFECYGFFEFV